MVARGAAYADFDRDGDLDILISTNHGPACLFRNDGGNRNHWVHLTLEGVQSNRSALGAVVTVASAQGKQTQTVHSGSSYCSQSELGLTFGLGKDEMIHNIDIQWPSGKRDHFTNIKANRFLKIREGQAIIP